jgi:hypothetical protein
MSIHATESVPRSRGVVAAAWAFAGVAAVAVVKGTAIGPVVLTISEAHGWGVHTGDSLVLVPLAVATVLHVKRWPSRR